MKIEKSFFWTSNFWVVSFSKIPLFSKHLFIFTISFISLFVRVIPELVLDEILIILGGPFKFENMSNKELAEELHKTIIRKTKKRNINSPFIDNIWGANLTDMELISKFNRRSRFLLCFINIFSKYARVISLKDKKCITMLFKKY